MFHKIDPQIHNSLLRLEYPSVFSYFRAFGMLMIPNLPTLLFLKLHREDLNTTVLAIVIFPPKTVRTLSLQVNQSLGLYALYYTRCSKEIQ